MAKEEWSNAREHVNELQMLYEKLHARTLLPWICIAQAEVALGTNQANLALERSHAGLNYAEQMDLQLEGAITNRLIGRSWLAK